MKFQYSTLINVAVFLSVTLLSSATAATTEAKAKENVSINCLGTPLVMPENMRKSWKECYAKYEPGVDPFDGKGIEPKNLTCIMVCFLKELSVISADNKFEKKPIAEVLKQFGFPEKIVEPFTKALDVCIDEKGSTFDGSCKSISTMYSCAGTAFQKMCLKEKEEKS